MALGSIIVQGAVLGLVATLAMDVVMGRLEEGETAPTVAASVLTSVSPEKVSDRRANAIHYGAGAGSGILFLGVLQLSWQLLGVTGPDFGLRGAVGLIVTITLVFAWLVGFFSLVVLPRYDAPLSRQRLQQIRRDWGIAASTHVVALAVLWLLLTRVV